MKKYFLAGIVTLIPLAITFWAISFIIGFLTSPFLGMVTSFLKSYPAIAMHVPGQAIVKISQALILIFLFLFILSLGFTARFFFLKSILIISDKILHKIPFVNKVYKISKEIIHSLFKTDSNSFKQVVLLPFPYKRAYCLGLVSSTSPDTCLESTKSDLVTVFIPTSPNPTTGYMVMCKKDELIPLEMSSEAALKYIISCAVIQPGSK